LKFGFKQKKTSIAKKKSIPEKKTPINGRNKNLQEKKKIGRHETRRASIVRQVPHEKKRGGQGQTRRGRNRLLRCAHAPKKRKGRSLEGAVVQGLSTTGLNKTSRVKGREQKRKITEGPRRKNAIWFLLPGLWKGEKKVLEVAQNRLGRTKDKKRNKNLGIKRPWGKLLKKSSNCKKRGGGAMQVPRRRSLGGKKKFRTQSSGRPVRGPLGGKGQGPF